MGKEISTIKPKKTKNNIFLIELLRLQLMQQKTKKEIGAFPFLIYSKGESGEMRTSVSVQN